MSKRALVPIRAFNDNYIWLFADEQSAWIVDPGDAVPVMDYLKQHQMNLAGILITHHHRDHSGGVQELLTHWKGIPVIGSAKSQVVGITDFVKEQDEVQCGSLHFRVLEIPGHTLDHIAFYNEEILFCGDTLFSAGCGRVFEGTMEQMYQSLQKLSNLPDAIKIYCAHEYTLQNLAFAQHVESTNLFIQQKILDVKEILAQGRPSLPSVLSEEKKMNPFLRCQEVEVVESAEKQASTKLESPQQVFQLLREWKNNF